MELYNLNARVKTVIYELSKMIIWWKHKKADAFENGSAEKIKKTIQKPSWCKKGLIQQKHIVLARWRLERFLKTGNNENVSNP